MHACVDDRLVQRGDALQGLGGIPSGHLDDLVQAVRLVAGVDPLGRIAHEEVLLPAQARGPLQDRHAHVLGTARIHRGLEHHRCAAAHVAAHHLAGAAQRCQVGLVHRVNRGRHRNDEEIGVLEPGRIARHRELARSRKLRAADVAHRVHAPAVGGDLLFAYIEADGGQRLAEGDRQRQAYVSEADDGNRGCHCKVSSGQVVGRTARCAVADTWAFQVGCTQNTAMPTRRPQVGTRGLRQYRLQLPTDGNTARWTPACRAAN